MTNNNVNRKMFALAATILIGIGILMKIGIPIESAIGMAGVACLAMWLYFSVKE